jgi:hypothetical protein
MRAFLHQLWITLAILASCGLFGAVGVAPRGDLDLAAGSAAALSPAVDLLGKAAVATLRGGDAKRPSCKVVVRNGQERPDQDGDGPAHDPARATEALDVARWLGLDEAPALEWSRTRVRALQGLAPDEGGKRGPPAPQA